MKKLLVAFTLCISVVANAGNAPKSKLINEGRVVYDITADGDINPMMAAMLPTELTMFLKGPMLKSEMKGTGFGFVTIIDTKAKTSTNLIDMMGKKSMVKSTPEDLDKAYAEHKPTVKILKETKVIAGFKCNKAEITSSKGNVSYVYFTKAIASRNGYNLNLRDIDGFLMEYEINQANLKLKVTARSVNGIEKVPDSSFEIPEGYNEVKKEDLQKMAK